jgi:predicted dehydrogenase
MLFPEVFTHGQFRQTAFPRRLPCRFGSGSGSEASLSQLPLSARGNRGSALLKGTLRENGVKVVAVCDIKPDRLDSAATMAARDKPNTYRDWRRIIDLKDVKAVFIATPCDLHVEMALAAYQAGKHIYCEKPIGVTAESVNRLWRAGKDSKLVFQTGLGLRSSARNKTVIDKIRGGIAGKLVMIRAHRTADDDLDHNGPSADWFFNAKRSGDVIVEMAVHNLDLCNWVADSRPEWAAGAGGALCRTSLRRTNMDGYTLTYEYANGIKMSFTQVFFHPSGMPGGGQALGSWNHRRSHLTARLTIRGSRSDAGSSGGYTGPAAPVSTTRISIFTAILTGRRSPHR